MLAERAAERSFAERRQRRYAGLFARDLKPVNFEDVLQQSTEPVGLPARALSSTDPHHIATTPSAARAFHSYRAPDDAAIDRDGQYRLAGRRDDAGRRYAGAVSGRQNIYAKAIGMMRTARHRSLRENDHGSCSTSLMLVAASGMRAQSDAYAHDRGEHRQRQFDRANPGRRSLSPQDRDHAHSSSTAS